MSNHMPIQVWNEIAYPFPNFNDCTIKVWEWIINFIRSLLDIIHAGIKVNPC